MGCSMLDKLKRYASLLPLLCLGCGGDGGNTDVVIEQTICVEEIQTEEETVCISEVSTTTSTTTDTTSF